MLCKAHSCKHGFKNSGVSPNLVVPLSVQIFYVFIKKPKMLIELHSCHFDIIFCYSIFFFLLLLFWFYFATEANWKLRFTIFFFFKSFRKEAMNQAEILVLQDQHRCWYVKVSGQHCPRVGSKTISVIKRPFSTYYFILNSQKFMERWVPTAQQGM